MTKRSASRALWFTAALLASGCFGTQEPGQQGELGNDRFFYACVVDSDALCDGNTDNFEEEPIYGIPVIALGSKFGITTEGISTEARIPGDREYQRLGETVGPDGTYAFEAKTEGWSVLLSETYNGDAVDILHVKVVAPAGLAFFNRSFGTTGWNEGDSPSISLSGNQRQELRAAPKDDQDALLAGGLALVWSAEPEGIVQVTPAAGNNVVVVVPVKDGSATVTVSYGDFSQSALFQISGAGEGGGGQGGGGQGGGGPGGGGPGGGGQGGAGGGQ